MRSRALLAIPVLAAVGMLAAQVITSQAAGNPQLDGLVMAGSPAASLLSLKQGGVDVTTLTAGTYDIAIADEAMNHDFQVLGAGVADGSGVPETFPSSAPKRITVAFVPGTYDIHCSAHLSMRKTFTVTAPVTTTTATTAPPPAPPPPPVPPPPTAKPTLVKAKIGPGGGSLSPATAVAGPATITLVDRSRRGNAHLKGPGVNVRTGIRSKAVRRVDATLQAGTYRLIDDAHPKRRARTLVVTAP